jgi:hypothetical protein
MFSFTGILWTSIRPFQTIYQTTHNSFKKKTFMPPAGFELAILTSNQPQIHALDRPEE